MPLLKTTALIIVATLAIALPGCSTPDEAEPVVFVNLIPAMQAAQYTTDTSLLDPASSRENVYFQSGWGNYFQPEDEEFSLVASTGKTALLTFNVYRLEDRLLRFDFSLKGPWGQLEKQQMQLLVNGKVLDQFSVTQPKWQAFETRIPTELLHRGQNRLVLQFDHQEVFMSLEEVIAVEDVRKSLPVLSGYFRNIRFLPARNKGNKNYLPEEESIQLSEDKLFIRQRQGSSITLMQEIDKPTLLRLKGSAITPNPQGKSISITVRSNNGLSGEKTARARFESPGVPTQSAFALELQIPPAKETVTEIEISVDSQARFSEAHVVWESAELQAEGNKYEKSATPEKSVHEYDHILIVLLDALRADVVGAYGAEFGATPNIDAFAADALLFERVVAPVPQTQPSVASMFTGLIVEEHGVRVNLDILDDSIPYLPEILHNNGYQTALLTGNPAISNKLGMARGMDREENIWDNRNSIEMNLETIRSTLEDNMAARGKTFTYIHLLPPHEPRQPPQPFGDKYIADNYPNIQDYELNYLYSLGYPDLAPFSEKLFRHYLNNTAYADYLFGEILSILRQGNRFEETLIVLVSDHGEAFGEHGYVGHNDDLHDEMIRVPLIIKGSSIAKGTINSAVGLVDIMPTVLDFAGIDSDQFATTGKSFSAHAEEQTEPEKTLYYSKAQGFSLTSSTHKFLANTWLYEYFDLQQDPREKINLIEEYARTALYLRQLGMMILLHTPLVADQVETSEDEELKNQLKDLGYLQ